MSHYTTTRDQYFEAKTPDKRHVDRPRSQDQPIAAPGPLTGTIFKGLTELSLPMLLLSIAGIALGGATVAWGQLLVADGMRLLAAFAGTAGFVAIAAVFTSETLGRAAANLAVGVVTFGLAVQLSAPAVALAYALIGGWAAVQAIGARDESAGYRYAVGFWAWFNLAIAVTLLVVAA